MTKHEQMESDACSSSIAHLKQQRETQTSKNEHESRRQADFKQYSAHMELEMAWHARAPVVPIISDIRVCVAQQGHRQSCANLAREASLAKA
jgi:ribose 1,5-bisphosphokinase PhnN